MKTLDFAATLHLINSHRKQIPVDLDSLCMGLGVQVKRSSLDDGISGMLELKRDGHYLITINSDHPKTRQRFTQAHELGHFVLHRHLVGDGVDDNAAYRSTNQGRYHNTDIGPEEETEANRFAANLLMPMPAVREKWTELEDVAAMARLFGVSTRAMTIRLELLPAPAQESALTQYA
jgi:Zn-dependent peptidase ImmA (M78 family)